MVEFGLGLEQDRVRLVRPDRRWPAAFAAEARKIEAALAGCVEGIEHIGSTSVPGMRAKPIIDIMVGVRPLGEAALYKDALAELGYAVLDRDVSGDHIFTNGPKQTYLVHLVEMGGFRWTQNLGFRDRLRADPDLARRYGELKAELADRHRDDRLAYTSAKAAFIVEVLGDGAPSGDGGSAG